jgi:putative methionine-R-sulfoxide reductase with GAF domain
MSIILWQLFVCATLAGEMTGKIGQIVNYSGFYFLGKTNVNIKKFSGSFQKSRISMMRQIINKIFYVA